MLRILIPSKQKRKKTVKPPNQDNLFAKFISRIKKEVISYEN